MPPTAVRRPLAVIAWLLIGCLWMALAPVALSAAWLLATATGERRPLIFFRLLTAYSARELATMAACGALWVASGAGVFMRRGPFPRLHWRLLRWYVNGIAAEAISAMDLSVERDHDPDALRALESDRPLLVFSRHAGPGDTVLLIDQLLTAFRRHPSVVFKEALAIDPCIDLLGHRLPHAVLDTSDRSECETQISRVSRELGDRGALLLFPEGGNFTPERRRAALRKLRNKGRRRELIQAERMHHVLPPHPTGVATALAANHEADVIFAAHTGLGLAAYPAQMWREMPIGCTLRMRMWHVPASEVPTDEEAQTEWLYEWWGRIDEWVSPQE